LRSEAIRPRIDQFAARLATSPRSLKAQERRALIRELKESGCMEVRRAMEIVALHLGVSRAGLRQAGIGEFLLPAEQGGRGG
jgi:predicted transcriptional regulator YheO